LDYAEAKHSMMLSLLIPFSESGNRSYINKYLGYVYEQEGMLGRPVSSRDAHTHRLEIGENNTEE